MITDNRYRCFKATLPAGTYSVSYNADLNIVRYINLTTGTNIAKKKFTLTEESTITYGFRRNDGAEWNLGETLADIEFQIEKSETVTEYEEYCGGIPSPNLQYPQELQNITGNCVLKLKNSLAESDENYKEQTETLPLRNSKDV